MQPAGSLGLALRIALLSHPLLHKHYAMNPRQPPTPYNNPASKTPTLTQAQPLQYPLSCPAFASSPVQMPVTSTHRPGPAHKLTNRGTKTRAWLSTQGQRTKAAHVAASLLLLHLRGALCKR
jgi:hypothetical protein